MAAADAAMIVLIPLLLHSAILWSGISAQSTISSTPPRGWNSYDSFSWIVSEDEFLANAQVVADSLQQFGYEYVVVDFLWFRKNVKGASMSSPGYDIIDEWGRLVPDPVRWPSTAGGKGFAPIAAKVHAMGLKFGIHVMRGISTAALQQNTPVLGAPGWRARDIALPSRPCSWMKDCFVSVDTSSVGGKAFLDSLYQQYASWGVHFIKHDCVFGVDDLSLDEIQAVSTAISATNRAIVYSLSPGVKATPSMGKSVASAVNMYRVTSDDWDSWGDLQLHFDVARDFAAAGLIGASGLEGGRSWPDLDMLPIGWITDPGVRRGPHRYSNLTPDEEKLQMSLWAMAKSPLIYGGDLRKIDQDTLSLITNSVMLGINSHSFRNMEISAEAVSGNEVPSVLRLSSCSDSGETRWSLVDQKMCWSVPKFRNGSGELMTGCLDWTNATNSRKTGHVHLSSELGNLCLKSYAKLPRAFGSLISSSFSSCPKHGSEKWKLTPDGKLHSRSTGLCAAVYPQVYSSRVWSARGSDGEYYVGLFNVGSKAAKIAITVANLVNHGTRSKPGSSSDGWECDAMDIWSNKNIGVISDALEASVPAHGAALFSLTCSPTKR
ncbi:hypothetical protein SELMODRAFT_444098 [Selaginella moellendorffii]|uniref:Alpha-galactosidase n=1 Tax=Selaginella moellendorffii TaxID=88036 RepID=D8S6F5_SELML|nr:alpha-galactosidase [Selaginella moellendorffii]EFJ20054.1 hypothetical protein SELMODRAFT_444098 [Selaginella moellendorffii]|eukprot:XP_002979097.1 alpha-galactosidase [Selaginella moellendorffii]